MLVENTIFGERDKVKIAIDRLRTFEPPEGYYLAFSGGKDSQCIYHLAKEAGVKFDAHYNLTTVDPPELVYFIRENYPDVIVERPKESMWKLIVKNGMPPTRLIRYCCDELKEGGGTGRIVITGVRWEESRRRRRRNWKVYNLNAQTKNQIKLMADNDEDRKLIENCVMKSKHVLNPIIDWLESDVWQYLNNRNLPHCKLYDEGFKRIGCIGCPMSNRREQDFQRWPKYRANYLRTFARMLKEHPKGTWQTPEDVMHWWIYGSDKEHSQIEGQMGIDELEECEVDALDRRRIHRVYAKKQ